MAAVTWFAKIDACTPQRADPDSPPDTVTAHRANLADISLDAENLTKRVWLRWVDESQHPEESRS